MMYLFTLCGVAASMTRVSGVMDGASQATMDGEKRPLAWELGPHAEQLRILNGS